MEHRLYSACRQACIAGVLLAALSAGAFDLQGHRGARGLAPENTMAAFEHALTIGVTTLELDIAITADGVAVVHHDLALNPAITRDNAGRWLSSRGPLLRNLTVAQLTGFDVGRIDPSSPYAKDFPDQKPQDGERVPTLDALFARVKELGADRVRFNIEIKTNPTQPSYTAPPQSFVDALITSVRTAGLEQRVLVQSFDWNVMQRVRISAPDLELSFLTIQNARVNHPRDPVWTGGLLLRDFPSVPHMVQAAGGAVWTPNFEAVTADLVKLSESIGVKVVPWTVNDPADMRRLIEWGVDGVITDYPDRLRAVMSQRGMELPEPVAMR